jgi:membrane associated rhomboid family serine protease
MSDEPNPQQNQGISTEGKRQPILLLPASVTALCGVLIVIHLAKTFVLNVDGQASLLEWFAFVPARLIAPEQLAGGYWPLLWTPFTHAFLHAGWEHLFANVAWLAIFGTPVARRYGAAGLLILFLVGALVGAVAFAATTLPQVQVLLGASGGIAALTGAALRFIFQPVVVDTDPETGERRVLGRRLASLRETWRNPTARFFGLVWIVLNGLVPFVPLVMGSDVDVAWQAHIFGFLAGLLLVPLFERRPREEAPDA